MICKARAGTRHWEAFLTARTLLHQNRLPREPSRNKLMSPKVSLSMLMSQHRHNGEVTSRSPFTLWERLGRVGEQYQCPNLQQDEHKMHTWSPVQSWGHLCFLTDLSLGQMGCWCAPADPSPCPHGAVPMAKNPSVQQLLSLSWCQCCDPWFQGAGAERALLQLRGAGITPGALV